jgi:hypothetical protein
MSDTVGTIPIVNGATTTVQEGVLETTIGGNPAVIPLFGIWQSGTNVTSGNPLPVGDSAVIANTGSAGAINVNLGSVVANTGALHTDLVNLLTQGSTAANTTLQAQILTELSLVATALGGTLVTKATPPILNVLSTGTLGLPGVPSTVLTANQSNQGGFVLTNDANGMTINQTGGTASLTGGPGNIPLAGGQGYTLLRTANSLSLVSQGTSIAVVGYGLQA